MCQGNDQSSLDISPKSSSFIDLCFTPYKSASFPELAVQVVVGVVYNPIMEEMFTAVSGKGAFLNGKRIHASSCDSLGSALAVSEIGVTRDDETLDALFGRISALTKKASITAILPLKSDADSSGNDLSELYAK